MPKRLESARFFFHLVSDTEMIRDQDGLELPIHNDVLSYTACVIEQLRHEGFLPAEALQDWHIEVTDGTGRTLLSIPLDWSDVAYRPRVLN